MKSQMIILAIVGLIIIGFVLFFIFGYSNMNSQQINNPGSNDSGNGLVSGIGVTKTFLVNGENFKFTMNGQDNPDIVVNQGDNVKIVFTSAGGFHDFVIDEFNVATKRVNDGQQSTIEFVANTKGTFEYYCSVGEHRQMGMRGNFIVQ